MIGYVTLGTNDLPRAAKFYDAVAGEMGVGRMMGAGRNCIPHVPAATGGVARWVDRWVGGGRMDE